MVRVDGVLLEARRPAFSLDDLVARCDSTAPEPAHMTGRSNTKPVGREVW
ncbi:MazE protein [Massilia psychrophila]|uniref:MazE protein n=1 Tax=Massilia psychrophila TaxID=1603353 RepID=A0A2G8SXJ1_9BURK|nr:MazE protein [Massilia psychrophila]